MRVGMIASGLYNLATAEPEKVEEVMAACEAGQKLNGARIKAIVGKSDAAAASPDEVGRLRPPFQVRSCPPHACSRISPLFLGHRG